jgi:hypothetical protein
MGLPSCLFPSGFSVPKPCTLLLPHPSELHYVIKNYRLIFRSTAIYLLTFCKVFFSPNCTFSVQIKVSC